MSEDLVGWAKAVAIEQRKDRLLREALEFLDELNNEEPGTWVSLEELIEDIKEVLNA